MPDMSFHDFVARSAVSGPKDKSNAISSLILYTKQQNIRLMKPRIVGGKRPGSGEETRAA